MRFLFPAKKFADSLNTAVFTTTHVMKEGSLIVLVSHELDGAWQFMGNEPIEDYREIAMVVSLENIIKMDKSVLNVADLPMGYRATRQSKKDKWAINKIDYSEEELKEFGFYCATCGQYHNEIPMAYGAEAPHQYALIPETEREQRGTLTKDQCIIDDKEYFIRGRIELRVDEKGENFLWNVWVQISEKDFERMSEFWDDENRVLEKPYTGIIAGQLEPYPDTLGLKVLVITQKVGISPIVELIETNHPLYFEQENGITMDRVVQFAKEILYQH